MLIVDLYKYWHEQEEGKQRQLKKKKIQLFNPIIKGKKSLLGIGNIQMTFDLQGDSYRMNELESNGQLYSLGTVWDTLSDKKFDFYADRIDLDNNKGTCEINGFSLINLFNTQLRLDFSKEKYSSDSKYHSPNLLEIWQEIKESLIERDKIINSYFWKEMAVFKNSEKPSVGVDKDGKPLPVPEEVIKEFNKLTDTETTTKVYEYNNYMGQNMVVNLWQFLRPLLVYCDYRLDMWLVDGVLNLKLKSVIKEPVKTLNEFKDLLTIEDMKPKYNIIEATIKYESVIPSDGKREVTEDEYRKIENQNKQLDPVPYIYSEKYKIDDNFDEEKQKPYKKANGDFDESKIRVLDITYVYGKYLNSSYTWEKFNFDKSLPIMIPEGFIWEYDEYLDYGKTEKHKGFYNANIFLNWTQDKRNKYYLKKDPKVTPRPNDIATVRYALDTDNRIVKLEKDTNVNIKFPFNLAYFEEKTLTEAQSKAILTLAKNRYAYRITYIANVDTYKQPFYVGDYVEVYFYGKTLKLPITEIEYENMDNQLQETIILGADIPEIEELVAYGVKKGAEVKV